MERNDDSEAYPSKKRGFHIAHLNVQSMKNKLTELSIYVKDMNFVFNE